MIYEGYMGVVKMKVIVRSYILWLGIDVDIYEFVKKCCGCMNYCNIFLEVLINFWEFLVKFW